ncbi:hypothetical protein MKX34_11800 [Paenibacillus sp. FSL R5-0636]|uniref:hypothetical protein n=1 Tax=Paenibacillus TaxID=44249 RepID=UPI00096D2BD1|nr:hypothetical protein [Paenibacillus odorifer]OMD00911.1 hypothetical protein BJP46_18960 [Paenibacillus odorifer]OMD04741.1 hypothetical protein BJP49_23010 [Paenibacillus odorifer]OME07522.1 hypothetical protein BSK60_31055 [Paenibacillus odorifer]
MNSIAASLALNDAFSQRLAQVNTVLASTLQLMARLQSQVQNPITLRISAFDVIHNLDIIKQQIAALGTGSLIRISINSSEILQRLTTIRQQLGGEESILKIRLNTADINSEIAAIRRQIDSELGNIQARIRIELPRSLEAMFVNLQRLVLQLIRVTRQLRTRTSDADGLRQALERIARLEQQIADLQSRVNGRVREAGKSSSAWLSNIKGLVAAYLSLASAKALFEKTVGGAMEQQKMEDMFKARTGDAEIGKAMFDKFKDEALAAGQDVTKSLQSTLSFFSTTQNTDQLSQLNNLAQRLNAFDSAGNGIEGAAFALKEAMSGDIVSLAERFNMSKSDIRAFNIDDLGKAGNMEGFIKAFDQLLEKQQMGQKAFDTMMASPAKQVEVLGNNLRSTLADAGGAAVQSLMPLISMINTAFQDGTFQPFFDGLSTALDWVVQNAIRVLDIATEIYNFFSSNWTTIAPIITGLAGAFALWKGVVIASNVVMGIQNLLMGIAKARQAYLAGATLAQAAATTTATGAQVGLNAAILANPLTWVIVIIIAVVAAIYFLVKWLINLWKTNDQFAAGMMRAWNAILNFFDQVPIFFMKVGYGIADAFGYAKVESLKLMEDLANGAIDRLNKLIEKLNGLKFVSIKAIGHVEFATGAAAEEEAARQQRAAKITAAENGAAKTAAEREAKVQKMLEDRADKRAKDQTAKEAEELAKQNKNKEAAEGYDFSKWDSTHTGAGNGSATDNDKKNKLKKVDKVGKVEKPIDISKEDLKVMRDVAEMKNIQNFVTLTPTIQVKTGPVHNETNVDSIVSKITKKLNEDIVSTAKGVYS